VTEWVSCAPQGDAIERTSDQRFPLASAQQPDARRLNAPAASLPPPPDAYALRDALTIAAAVAQKCWPDEVRQNPTPWERGIAQIAPGMVAAKLHLDAHEWGRRLAVLAPVPGEARPTTWTPFAR